MRASAPKGPVMRRGTVAALAIGLLVPAPSLASAQTRCPLISDPAGDAIGLTGNRDDLDLVSVDLKVVGSTLTTELRIRQLPESGTLGTGWIYSVYVTRDGIDYTVQATITPSEESYTVQTGSAADPSAPYRLVDVQGSDDHRHRIRVVAPLSAFSTDGSAGTSRRLTGIYARTSELSGDQLVYAGSSVDDAGESATYSFGQRACF